MIWKALGGIVLVVFIALAIGIATRPDTFRVERKTHIAAPATVVFAHINDFHEWAKWSPWEKIDTDLNKTYAGPPSGVGAIYSWSGKKTGDGTMTLKESTPNRTAIDLEFTKPMEAKNLAEFTSVPAGDGVDLTWTMSGANTTMGKAFSLVMSMDKMIGNDFEKGLADLKSVSEADAKAAPAGSLPAAK